MSLDKYTELTKKWDLWLFHIGHSWYIILNTSSQKNITAESLAAVIPKFPKSYKVQELRKITDPLNLKKYAEINGTLDSLISSVNAERHESGLTVVCGLRGWGV